MGLAKTYNILDIYNLSFLAFIKEHACADHFGATNCLFPKNDNNSSPNLAFRSASFGPKLIVISVELSVTLNASTNFPFSLYFGQYLSQFEINTYLLKARIYGTPKYSRLSLSAIWISWFVLKHNTPTKHAFSLVESWVSWHHKCPNLSGFSGLSIYSF